MNCYPKTSGHAYKFGTVKGPPSPLGYSTILEVHPLLVAVLPKGVRFMRTQHSTNVTKDNEVPLLLFAFWGLKGREVHFLSLSLDETPHVQFS